MPEETSKPPKLLICPHCGATLTTVESRDFGKVVLIGCSQCFKVIAGSFHPEK